MLSEEEIAKHTGLAMELAHKYFSAVEDNSLDIEDLEQEAYIALCKAAGKYDPERGVRSGCQFQSYAGEVIKQQLRRYIINTSAIRIPEGKFDDYVKIRKAHKKIYSKNPDINPSVEDIAAITGFTIKKIKEITQLIESNRHCVSLNRQIDDESEAEIIELIEDKSIQAPETNIAETEMTEKLQSILSMLDKRELAIIALRYGLAGQQQHTYQQIGKLMNYSHEFIRQEHNKALKKIRKQFDIQQLTELFCA